MNVSIFFIHPVFIRQQKNLFDHAHLLLQVCNAHILHVCTCTGLLLRVDKYEPQNFRQFSTEQSIANDNIMFQTL